MNHAEPARIRGAIQIIVSFLFFFFWFIWFNGTAFTSIDGELMVFWIMSTRLFFLCIFTFVNRNNAKSSNLTCSTCHRNVCLGRRITNYKVAKMIKWTIFNSFLCHKTCSCFNLITKRRKKKKNEFTALIISILLWFVAVEHLMWRTATTAVILMLIKSCAALFYSLPFSIYQLISFVDKVLTYVTECEMS